MAFKAWTRLRDIARARPDEIATREIRGYRVECPYLKGQICIVSIDNLRVISTTLNPIIYEHKIIRSELSFLICDLTTYI